LPPDQQAQAWRAVIEWHIVAREIARIAERWMVVATSFLPRAQS